MKLKLAKDVNALARIRLQITALTEQANRHRSQIIRAGGGMSKRWIAKVVKIQPWTTHFYRGATQVRLIKRGAEKSGKVYFS